MSARVAFSSRLSPSLLKAFLLDSPSFSAFAHLSNKRLSPSFPLSLSSRSSPSLLVAFPLDSAPLFGLRPRKYRNKLSLAMISSRAPALPRRLHHNLRRCRPCELHRSRAGGSSLRPPSCDYLLTFHLLQAALGLLLAPLGAQQRHAPAHFSFARPWAGSGHRNLP